MKASVPFHRYTGKENAAIRFITDAIINHLDPLIIYCLTSVSNTSIERSCFNNKKRITEWTFECDLMIVVPDNSPVHENTKAEISKLTEDFGEVNVFIHPLEYVEEKIKEGSSLFVVARRDAVVFYKRESSVVTR